MAQVPRVAVTVEHGPVGGPLRYRISVRTPPGVHEVADLKNFFGTHFGTFCPGIRPIGASHGDQKRAATPREAREAGADYVVVGRPIIDDADPVAAARAILDELSS